MANQYSEIEKKLKQFTNKYYKSELIKGSILFLSLGFLYLFFTLFIEYFLWLMPNTRTLLFWLFVLVECFLFTRFILFPIAKLIGIKKGISAIDSSRIIGRYFPEVSDKLLNIIQLKDGSDQSDLILASIDQKAAKLRPIPFAKAIKFKSNIKYLKFAVIPFFLIVISLMTNITFDLTNSLNRVVQHRTAFVKPAPFSFVLKNEDLTVVQGKDLEIVIQTEGDVSPTEAKVLFSNQEYYLQRDGNSFTYSFINIQEAFDFYVEANEVRSENFSIQVIKTPTIENVELELNYPEYLNRPSEITQNNARILIPEGTDIQWKVNTLQTDRLTFIENANVEDFVRHDDNEFRLTKKVKRDLTYKIASSNRDLNDYEILDYQVKVIKDEYPKISVTTNIDSISRGDAQFFGQVSDDYGFSKLELIYYEKSNPTDKIILSIPTSKEMIQTFFYEFPGKLTLKEGVNYELFFKIYDNDEPNGFKLTKSQTYQYRQKSDKEIEQELLMEQRNTINDLENALQNQEKQQEVLEELQLDLQNKKDMNWNDKKKLDRFVDRQERYKEMMQRQTKNLLQNLNEIEETNEKENNKKEVLKERIKELQKLDKQQRLLDELQEMADKLNKQDLVKKAKELAQQNRQQQRSLEKTLEMVKRFYVEQKTMQIANKLNELSEEQKELSEGIENNQKDQQKIVDKFDELKKELDEVNKDNELLKEPMDLPDVEQEKDEIDESLNDIKQSQQDNPQKQTRRMQKKASNKMNQMSQKMQNAMMSMQGQAMEENMDDLRRILENLILFSFEQEQLVEGFESITTTHPSFGKNLQKQNDIKTYFNHIDDSLYVLAMRVPDISTVIQDDLSSVHYNIDQSMENFSENRFSQGITNQRYVMTATNNLSDYLSNTLNNMQNNMSMQMGKGQKGGNNFSLPDLIQKQGELSEKLEQGLQKSKGKGSKNKEGQEDGQREGESGEGNSDDLNGQLYEIFKEQSRLREALENAIDKGNTGSRDGKKVIKSMEQLENDILEKGFSPETYQRMQELNYQLLKLKEATFKQGLDNKRKSTSNNKEFGNRKIKALKLKKRYYKQLEILNRQSLPLQENYKKRVRTYFYKQS